jgi:hypothetical protein
MLFLHNDGGANCFIFNDPKVFWTMTSSSLSVQQLDGSSITVVGTEVFVIHPLLALWPSFYYPMVPQHTFSPNAIKHYLQIPLVQMEHASHLQITMSSEIQLKFPSLPVELQATGFNFF